MGAIVSAPASAVASCAGGCSAVLCAKLLESGTVSSDRAALNVLLWLQVIATLLSVAALVEPHTWLSGPCSSLGDLGICACLDDACYARQLVYRVQAAASKVFAILLLLTLSGCAKGASRSYVMLKLSAVVGQLEIDGGVVFLTFAFLFVPNSHFDSIISPACAGASAIFLVAQAVFVIDMAYSLNERMYARSLSARRHAGSGEEGRWQAAILAFAAVFLVGAIAAAAALLAELPGRTPAAVVAPTLLATALLLLVSITDWCEHGALLTSTVVMAYSVWLDAEVLAASRDVDFGSPAWLRAAELLACASTLAALGCGAAAAPADVESASGLAAPLQEGPGIDAVDARTFAVHCVVHAVAALYICSALVPLVATPLAFGLRASALAAAVALYAWSLVAPRVLTHRTF